MKLYPKSNESLPSPNGETWTESMGRLYSRASFSMFSFWVSTFVWNGIQTVINTLVIKVLFPGSQSKLQDKFSLIHFSMNTSKGQRIKIFTTVFLVIFNTSSFVSSNFLQLCEYQKETTHKELHHVIPHYFHHFFFCFI